MAVRLPVSYLCVERLIPVNTRAIYCGQLHSDVERWNGLLFPIAVHLIYQSLAASNYLQLLMKG